MAVLSSATGGAIGSAPGSAMPAGARGAMVIATNNRFWRQTLGSHARVLAVYRHFVAVGWDVHVAFLGSLNGDDLATIARLGLPVFPSWPATAPAQPTPTPTPPPAARPVASRLRHLYAQTRRHLRALVTQPQRGWPAGGPRAWWRELTLRAQEPRVSDWMDPRHLARVESLCRSVQPACVLVEYVHFAWLAKAMQSRLPVNEATAATALRTQRPVWMLDTHDVMHERQQRFHAAGEVHFVDISRAEEAALISQFDVVMAIQRRDAGLLQSMHPAGRVVCVMHPQPLVPPSGFVNRPVGVAFVGSKMAPNVRAVRELLLDIWPRVRRACPGAARLLVAGAVCEGLEQGLDLPDGPGADVSLLGFVDNLDDLYGQIDIVASPIRIGGGLKIKNIDALCRGKALITTSVGAEGLEDGAGTAFVQADAAADFADALVRLIACATERGALQQAAFAFASERFSEDAVFRELDATLSDLAASRLA